MKIWFEELPKFKPTEDNPKGEIVVAEGVIDFQRRRIKNEAELFDFTDAVGWFARDDGATNYSVIESILVNLQGCKVRVKIEVLEYPAPLSCTGVDTPAVSVKATGKGTVSDAQAASNAARSLVRTTQDWP